MHLRPSILIATIVPGSLKQVYSFPKETLLEELHTRDSDGYEQNIFQCRLPTFESS